MVRKILVKNRQKKNSNGARDNSVTIDQERILMVREMLAYKSINGKF